MRLMYTCISQSKPFLWVEQLKRLVDLKSIFPILCLEVTRIVFHGFPTADFAFTQDHKKEYIETIQNFSY